MMAEQRPEQSVSQELVNQARNKSEPVSLDHKISRRSLLKGVGALAVSFALPTWLTGCGDKKTVPTTLAENPTTTKKTNEATTTKPSITTTTEAPTTTTTEIKAGIDPDYISKERTIDDVKGKIEKGKFLTEPDESVTEEMQKLFQSKNPKDKIVRQGRNGWRSVLTTKQWLVSESDSEGQAYNFFGAIPESAFGDYPDKAVMEFLDVIVCPDSPNPNFPDFYLRGINPDTGSEMYARIAMDKDITRDYPSVYPFDQAVRNQFDVLPGPRIIWWPEFLKSHKLSDIIQPHDYLLINFVGDGYGSGDIQNAKDIRWDVPIDKRGVQYASRVMFPIYDEAEKYRKIYKAP